MLAPWNACFYSTGAKRIPQGGRISLAEAIYLGCLCGENLAWQLTGGGYRLKQVDQKTLKEKRRKS